MVATMEMPISKSLILGENARIPRDLKQPGRVFEMNTIGDARLALARLRELRRDFDTNTKRERASTAHQSEAARALTLPGGAEEKLAGLSNIQRMRAIRSEIAFLEDLMVRIAAREFEREEFLHRNYLSGIGEWSEREGRHRQMS
jgi:hypothetical protein